jgi:heat shock protein HtpX
MLRLFLFFVTNIAVMALISLIFNLIGFQGLMQANGVDLDLNALLVYSAVIGFSGSFISLLLSKFMAKRSMGVKVISQASDELEDRLEGVFEGSAS